MGRVPLVDQIDRRAALVGQSDLPSARRGLLPVLHSALRSGDHPAARDLQSLAVKVGAV